MSLLNTHWHFLAIVTQQCNKACILWSTDIALGILIIKRWFDLSWKIRTGSIQTLCHLCARVCVRERSVCIYVHVNAQVFVSVLTLVYTCRGQRLMFMLLMAVKSRKEADMQFVITSTRKVR